MKRKMFLSVLIFVFFSGATCFGTDELKNDKTSFDLLQQKNEVNDSENIQFQKLETLLSSLNVQNMPRIFEHDYAEFLSDLQKVLDADSTKNDISLYFLVDKEHKIPADYKPKQLIPLKTNKYYSVTRKNLHLRKEAAKSLEEMAKAAFADEVSLVVSSSFRSYKHQYEAFNYWIQVDGREIAEVTSAKPGTSQHQLGTAVDFGSIDDSFAKTKQSQWLQEHAHLYGWSLSFPKGYEKVTGYAWESWHYRYVGKEACVFQNKWFDGIQQYMIEFIHKWTHFSE